MGKHLQQAGHQIVLGTRKAGNPPDWLPQAEVVQTSWIDSRTLEQACTGVDVVIHAAGMNAQDCAADPVAALEFNGLATARLVKAARRADVKRFIYLSTAHVYANPLVGTITEDTCPRNLHPYATSHLAGENGVWSVSQGEQVEGIVLRLSNAFGAPVHRDVNCWMLLVNDLCRQAVQAGKLVLHSSGFQQRDFIAIAEVCRVAEQLSSFGFMPREHSIFNVGSGRSQTVLEMAQLIQQRCKLILEFEPEIQRPEICINETPEILVYAPDSLAKMGVHIRPDYCKEIDRLLVYCHESPNEIQSKCV